MHWTAIIVFLLLFGGVTVMGFLAARRRGDLDQFERMGSRGPPSRNDRDLVSTVGIFTQPILSSPSAFVFGAVPSFFALPYTIIVYLCVPDPSRIWSVAHKHKII